MRPERTDGIAAAVLVVCWSSGFVGATFGTRVAPADTVLAWRTLVSAVSVGAYALTRRERLGAAVLLRQIVLGLLVQVLYLGGVFAAAGAGVPAGTSALIAALQPLLVAALAGPLLAERVGHRQTVGLIVGAVGVGVVVSGDVGTGAAPPVAYLLPMGSVLALACGTLLERRWRSGLSLVTSLAVQTSVAAVAFALLAASDGHLAPPGNGRFWLSISWLVVLASFGGYGTYLLVVRRSGATRASSLLYLTPPTTAVWAWILLGQAPPLTAVPGVVVCAVGVTLALRPTRTAEQPVPSGEPACAATPPGR